MTASFFVVPIVWIAGGGAGSSAGIPVLAKTEISLSLGEV